MLTPSTKVLEWLGKADADYIAARRLLPQDSLLEGATFSTTAVEKYLKAILCLANIDIPTGFKGHNLRLLKARLKSRGIALLISDQYLDLLFKLYQAGYPQDLPVGYNYAINRTKLLVELDYTVFEIRKGFSITGPNEPIETELDRLAKRHDPCLVERNCYFGTADRKQLFREDTFCMDMRVFPNKNPISVTYVARGVPDDRRFNERRLRPARKHNAA